MNFTKNRMANSETTKATTVPTNNVKSCGPTNRSAYLVSLFAIRFLVKFIQTHTFKPFGYYRIVLGVAVLLYFYVLA